jgi:Mg2+-importing ATPase
MAVVAIGMYLPFSPLASMLGFTPLPLSYFAFVAAATAIYLLMVEFTKRILLHRATRNNAPRGGKPLVAIT